jgi:hypothetical protein
MSRQSTPTCRREHARDETLPGKVQPVDKERRETLVERIRGKVLDVMKYPDAPRIDRPPRSRTR